MKILGMLQLNVRAKRLIEHFTGFSMSARSISHGLFDADDFIALRALAETMTGAIHFAPWPKPAGVDQFWLFHTLSFPQLRPRLIVQSANDTKRIMELVEKIKLEQDQGKFTVLVEELNRLLDSDQPVKKPTQPSA